jgi:hypothetical protein
MDVGKREDRLLDELEFLYQQRRDARLLVSEFEAEGLLPPGSAVVLLTLLADRVKKEGASV